MSNISNKKVSVVLAAAAAGAWFGSQLVIAIKQDEQTRQMWRVLTWIALVAPLGVIVSCVVYVSKS